MPGLPTEIILQIIDSLVEFGPLTPVAIPPWDVRCRTLYSFLTVSKPLHSIARRHLYRHCLYIDSAERLRLLLRSLAEANASTVPILPYISSLFISPHEYNNTIDDLPVAKWIYELFSIIYPTLKRLVIDMPLRSLYPEDDHLSVRPILRAAFLRLVNVEEFASARDELYLRSSVDDWEAAREETVWAQWPRLQKLALYNPDVDDLFADNAKSLQHLDTLVLTRADGVKYNPIRQMFLKDDECQHLRILDVNKEGFSDMVIDDGDTYTDDNGITQPVPDVKHFKGTVELERVLVRGPEQEYVHITAVQKTVRDAAIEGLLWLGEGGWTWNPDC
jgi:hypothetical protein